MADSGTVFRAGTTDVIAEIVQSGVERDDATLRRGLRIALAHAKDLPREAALAATIPAPS